MSRTRKTVNEDNWNLIAEFLRVLDSFRNIPWIDAQAMFVEELEKQELIKPYYEAATFSAVARMQLPVWKLLGLAWINEKSVPEVTEVGRQFINLGVVKRRELLSMQVHRYQFSNPTTAKHFNNFRTIPILSLYKLLQTVNWRLSRDEFMLLGSRVRTLSDAVEVANLVDDLRTCTIQEATELHRIANLLSVGSDSSNKRVNTYKKVKADIAYIWHFLRLSRFIKVEGDGLEIPPRNRRAVRGIVDASDDAEIIDYRSAQDWLAWYGEVPIKAAWKRPWATANTAKEYYQRIGRIDAATDALKREDTTISSESLDEYRRVQILERVLEDILEQNLGELEQGLTLVGRQFATAVGPIDILAMDTNESYVVIELKRGRTSDKVIGQVARYLGWVTERMVEGDESRARAIVVGRDYDAKFAAAVTQIRRVAPFTYDVRVRFQRWKS